MEKTRSEETQDLATRSVMKRFSSCFMAVFLILATVAVCVSPQSAEAQTGSSDTNDFRLTFDVSGSLGSSGGRGYQEISLGINAYFTDWFVWRNSGFSRFIEGTDNVYGLDTSARFVLNLGNSALGLTAFAGPGYRFATTGGNIPADSAPFAEGGIVAKLGGVSIGGGVKTVFNSVVRSGAPEDTQYFLILAGGGSL